MSATGSPTPPPGQKGPAKKSPGAPGTGKKSPGGAPGGKSPAKKSPGAPGTGSKKSPGAPGVGKKSPGAPGAGKKSPGAPGSGKSPGKAASKSPGPPTGKAAGKAPAAGAAKGKAPAGATSPGGPKAPPGGKSPAKGPTKGPGGKSPTKTPGKTGAKSPGAPPAGKGPAEKPKTPQPAEEKPKTPPAEAKPPTPQPAEPAAPPAAAPPVDQPPPPPSTAGATGSVTNTQVTGAPTVQQPASTVPPGTQQQQQQLPPGAQQQPGGGMMGGPQGSMQMSPSGPMSPGMMMSQSFAGDPSMSPIPAHRAGSSVAMSQAGRMAALRKEKRISRYGDGPLEVDPRTDLKIIDIPRDRVSKFQHLGKDLILHLFLDVDRISSAGKALRRVLFVTDTTLFICEEVGAVTRCVPVSKITQLSIATDNSLEVALVIPSEFDIILRFDKAEQRDDLVLILRMVFKRMVDHELNIRQVKDIRPRMYNMDRPQGFQLVMVPQRDRGALKRAIEAIDIKNEETEQARRFVEDQLDQEHQAEIEAKRYEAQVVEARLEKTQGRLKMQTDELEKLRGAYSKIKKRVEEIEAQFGAGGEAPASKDQKIRDLQEVVEKLSAAVARVNEQRAQEENARRAGNWVQKEIDDFDTQQEERLRGHSLHQQGLIDVLERQLTTKQQELRELKGKQGDLQKLNLDLLRKNELLKDLEQNVQMSRQDDPTTIFSGPSVAQMLGEVSPGASPGKDPGSPASKFRDPLLGLDSKPRDQDLTYDEDGEPSIGFGSLKKAPVNLGHDMPEYRLPADEKNFVTDPRTGLALLNVPEAYKEAFSGAMGTIIHFFSTGSKLNKRRAAQQRVIMVSDVAISLCTTTGTLNRCMYIVAVREVQVDKESHVALMLDGKDEYDLLVRFDGVETCDRLCTVLKRCSSFLKRQPPLKITRHDKLKITDLKLEKPPTWDFRPIHPRTKHSLYEALQSLSRTSAEERRRIRDASESYTREVVTKLKEQMRDEIDARQQREFAVLRERLRTQDALLRERQLEVRNLRRQMADHKCSVEHVKIAQSGAEMYETQGMYWIPTDPVVMECELEILHIQFYDNFIVTSHPNGFLNVWDISTADHYRTLGKVNGHTARVTAFYFDGRELISGGHDSSLRRWNIMEESCVRVVNGAHKGVVTGVQFDALNLISSGGDGVLHVWNPSTMKNVRSLKGHRGAITCFKFERNTLASAEWGWIFAWDIEKGMVLKALRDDNGGITTLDISGTNLITGGTGGVLTVWDLNTGEGEELEGHTDDVHCVQLQQHFAISSSSDCSIRMWNINDMIPLGVFHNSYPNESKKFHFKSNRFVVGENKTVKVWTR